MRAFMSTGSRAFSPADAEREALRIPAETEPEQSNGCGYVTVMSLHQPSTAGLALADAMRAFVERDYV